MSSSDPATPRGLIVFAIFAGAVTWFANDDLPLGQGMAMGLAAAAFWLFVGLALFRRRGRNRPSS